MGFTAINVRPAGFTAINATPAGTTTYSATTRGPNKQHAPNIPIKPHGRKNAASSLGMQRSTRAMSESEMQQQPNVPSGEPTRATEVAHDSRLSDTADAPVILHSPQQVLTAISGPQHYSVNPYVLQHNLLDLYGTLQTPTNPYGLQQSLLDVYGLQPTAGKRKREGSQSDDAAKLKLAKKSAKPSRKSPRDLITSREFHWREVSSGAAFFEIAGTGMPEPSSKPEQEPAQLSRNDIKTLLQGGCDCPDCGPSLYRCSSSDSPCTHEDAFPVNEAVNIARFMTRWNENVEPDEAAYLRWDQWAYKFRDIDFGDSIVAAIPEDTGLAEVTDIFSHLFFAGKLYPERVVTRWAHLDPSTMGETLRDLAGKDRFLIELNADLPRLALTRQCILETLLHEMCHAFIMAYSRDPRSWNKCPDSHSCRRRHAANVGVPCGHGRAWQAMAKVVEDFSEDKLGFKCEIGRADALNNRMHEHRMSVPCVRDAKRLYPWLIGTPHLRHKDDDLVCFERIAYRDRRLLDWVPWKVHGGSRRRKSI